MMFMKNYHRKQMFIRSSKGLNVNAMKNGSNTKIKVDTNGKTLMLENGIDSDNHLCIQSKEGLSFKFIESNIILIFVSELRTNTELF